MADEGRNVFSDAAVRRIRESVRRTEQEPVGDAPARRVRRGGELQELVFVELKTTLIEGTNYGATGHLLARRWMPSASLEVWERLPESDADNLVSVQDRPALASGQIRGAFRGVAFGYQTATLTASRVQITDAGASRGDVVACVRTWNPDIGTDNRGAFEYHAISSGAIALRGVAVEDAAKGSDTLRVDVTFATPYATDGRVARLWRIVATCDVRASDLVSLTWNADDCCWVGTPECAAADDEEEDPDPEDPADPPDGGGGGPGDAACYPCSGMPKGVDCSPLNCCPSDDDSLTVTDCEEFAEAPEEYYVEVPPLSCVPDCATGNEPDATSGLPPGRVTLTYDPSYTCVWQSDTFDCGDGVSWQWQLIPSLDGRSWLRLFKDGTAFLQWQTSEAWCPRCDNPVTIYCPPDECTDLTAKLCVKPVCTTCADAICYTVEGPDDWDGVESEAIVWSGASGNTGVGVTDDADGRPNPPSRRITLVYGHVPSEVDGAAVVETFPGIVFPAACGVDLDGVCGIELSVKVQSDDSVGNRGIKVGIAIKQGTDSFIATIGTVRRGEGWRTFEVARLLAADFDKVTTTGLDDATHPDWTLPATDMTFGVGLWQEDDTTDDALDDAITVVANWDILRLCLDHAQCTGGPASYTCPEALSIVACEEAGAEGVYTVDFENTGDSPFTLVSVGGAGALETACGGMVAIDTAGFLGPLAAGEIRSITITVDRTTPVFCDGNLTITTNLAGSELCVVPVTILVVAEAECNPEQPCVGPFQDNFDNDGDEGAIDLSTRNPDDIGTDGVKQNDFDLTYAVPSLCFDEDTEDEGTMPSGFEFTLSSTGYAEPTAVGALDGARLCFQELDGFPANFGTTWFATGTFFLAASGSNNEAVGFVLAESATEHITIQYGRNRNFDGLGGPAVGIGVVRWSGGVRTVLGYASYAPAGAVTIAVWRAGGSLKVAYLPGEVPDNAFTSLTGGGEVVDTTISGLAEFGLMFATGVSYSPALHVSHLCITETQGTAPPWEA